jgi:hypothetical protein
MTEYQNVKVSPASAIFLLVNFFSPASAFRNQGQSATAGLMDKSGIVR